MNLNQKAKAFDLGCCPCCQKINQMTAKKQRCSRCHHQFSQRKSYSVQYTFAWTLAAIVMFIPANIYPMMVFYTLGRPEKSTILEGIASFIHQGLYPIAFIIFLASFIIPLGKIIGLLILLYNTKNYSRISKKNQTKMYHLIASLGPWSMLDVFVVAVMAAVVNFGFFTSIEAGSGITYFTLMVIFTIFAAESFDPRLLWDIERRKAHDR
jgi:paraquat-inducible protein A